MPDPKKDPKRTTKSRKASETFTAEERAVMREVARERKAAAAGADGEKDVLAKITEMAEPDRALAERLHAIIRATAPALVPRTWYGMPAYTRDGKVICFFQAASKFKVRYATFGFQPDANLDDDTMWPTAFALTKLTGVNEARITELVKKAAG